MDVLSIEETENTPKVIFDSKKGVFEITGRSLTTNAPVFYAPLVAWLENYATHPNTTTELIFKLEYVNTGSSKMILNLFFALQKTKGAHISWYFLEDDEDMEEAGDEFAQLAGIPFELKAH